MGKARVAAGFVAAMLLLPVAASADCPAQAEPRVTVRQTTGNPSISRAYDTPGLERQAGRAAGDPDGWRPVGLYLVDIGHQVEVEAVTTTFPDGRRCVAIARVNASIGLQRPRILVSREIKVGSCRDRVVLAHERSHHALAAARVPGMRQAAEDALLAWVSDNPPRAIRGNGRAQLEAWTEAATAAVGNAVAPLRAELDRENAAIDTPESYAALQAACPGEP